MRLGRGNESREKQVPHTAVKHGAFGMTGALATERRNGEKQVPHTADKTRSVRDDRDGLHAGSWRFILGLSRGRYTGLACLLYPTLWVHEEAALRRAALQKAGLA